MPDDPSGGEDQPPHGAHTTRPVASAIVSRTWLVPPPPTTPQITDPQTRRLVGTEIIVVLTVTFGLSGLRSLVSLLDALLQPVPLNEQSVALNAPAAANDLADLAAQLIRVLQLVGWGALGAYLLIRAGFALRAVGLDGRQPGRDVLGAAGMAALIGIPGLGLYLVGQAIGITATVQPTVLDDTWWRTPLLLMSAAANAWAEEVVVVGYLLTRLRQLGWSENRALLLHAVVRGFYHLYQGFGAFIGNFVMGLVFGRIWQRTNRLWMQIVAHTLINWVAFVGYALLAGRVGWLP